MQIAKNKKKWLIAMTILIVFSLYFIQKFILDKPYSSQSNFTIIYSDAMADGAQILKYSSNGDILKTTKVPDGKALYYSTKVKDKYYIMSERKNHHLQIDTNDNISSFFGPSSYSKDKNIGTSFLRSNNKYIFYSMNVGAGSNYSPDKYLNELVYTKIQNDASRNIKLEGYIQSAVEKDDKAYVLYFSGTDNSIGIYVIDLNKNTILKNLKIDNHKSENGEGLYPVGQGNGSALQIFDNRLIIFLDGNSPKNQYKPIIKIFDFEKGEINEELKLTSPPFSINDIKIVQNKMYILSNDAVLLTYQNLNTPPQFITLEQDQKFIQEQQKDSGIISGFEIKDGYVYLLYDFVKNPPRDRKRELKKYNLQTGASQNTIVLKYRSSKEMIRLMDMN